MDFAFTEEQEALRQTARAFLAEHAGSAAVRAAMASEAGHDPSLWKRLGGELGWTAVAIPEAYGGLGLGAVELAALLEAMGEALLPSPFFATACLAAPALEAAGSGARRAEWLGAIAEGRTTATLAIGGVSGARDPGAIDVVAEPAAEGGVRLSGQHRFVCDGHTAERLVVAARRRGTSDAAGVSLFALPADTPGLERRLHPTMDATRRLAALDFRDVAVPAEARLGEEGEGGAILARALDRATVALAAEQVGGAQRCLDLAVDHAKERVQFGHPIGSFQAIKHTCADMMVRVESARSGACYAACVAAEDAPELPLAASLAKATASEAYFACAADALQVHGGVGFTWEYDVHLHLKRARAMEGFLGDPAWHRERVARHLLGEAP